MLDNITPVILTFNEAPNIARTLERLSWARDIVVVDSGSKDGTCRIVNSYSNTRLFQREFDSHARQWDFAITETQIESDWILALDADHAPTNTLLDELAVLSPSTDVNGYRIDFNYCIHGQRLRGSLYPALVSLYRTGCVQYQQQGHTQRVVVQGAIGYLQGRMLHDDRKPLTDWLKAQRRYMRLEAALIRKTDWLDLSMSNRVRRCVVVAPVAVFCWSLLARGTLFDGPAGWFYSMQRLVAESILSIYLLCDFCNSLTTPKASSRTEAQSSVRHTGSRTEC